ncbi:hypothetical protein P692DRAFT_20819499 [Suillus brevipes Sb2]|nr:hypothetical protein P692DRAFT_20819499 [Suillus brevipes Sb2]
MIIRLMEIILLELKYYKYIFTGNTDKWKICLMNVFTIGGVIYEWLSKQYKSGFFKAEELVTEPYASYYDYLIYLISQFSLEKCVFFDALLVDIHFNALRLDASLGAATFELQKLLEDATQEGDLCGIESSMGRNKCAEVLMKVKPLGNGHAYEINRARKEISRAREEVVKPGTQIG